MRGKEAARSASGAEAQEKAEDDGQEASDVHRRVGVGLLPAASFGGGRKHDGGQGGERPPRP